MMRVLAELVVRRPRAVLAIAAALAALGAWLGAFHLAIDSDTDSLILGSRPYMPAYRAFLAEFGDLWRRSSEVSPIVQPAASPSSMGAPRATRLK